MSNDFDGVKLVVGKAPIHDIKGALRAAAVANSREMFKFYETIHPWIRCAKTPKLFPNGLICQTACKQSQLKSKIKT